MSKIGISRNKHSICIIQPLTLLLLSPFWRCCIPGAQPGLYSRLSHHPLSITFAKLPSWLELRWSPAPGWPIHLACWDCPCQVTLPLLDFNGMQHHRVWEKLLGGHQGPDGMILNYRRVSSPWSELWPRGKGRSEQAKQMNFHPRSIWGWGYSSQSMGTNPYAELTCLLSTHHVMYYMALLCSFPCLTSLFSYLHLPGLIPPKLSKH